VTYNYSVQKMAYLPPSSAKPFTLSIPDEELADSLQLLRLSKLGPTTWENTQTEQGFGITRQWLSDARDYWLSYFDWRAQESYINSYANYKMEIENLDIHFIGYFSAKKDAVPIIFMHGWPGSFVEFLPMLNLVRKQYPTKDDLPYHIVIPSLPGYTLSSGGPLDQDWSMVDSARICHQLMLNLGFDRYISQGGDVGSFLAKFMAVQYKECAAVHREFFLSHN
jgi:microsomal epoxide hydrolase